MPSAGSEELNTQVGRSTVTMTRDIAQSTPGRPRAATTTFSAMGPPSPTARRLYGPSSLHGGSPPLGSSEHDESGMALDRSEYQVGLGFVLRILTYQTTEPLRHPKPLTPSDLHLVLEKEQEAMVSMIQG